LLIRSGFPCRHIGPQFDYLEAVARYSTDLMEFKAGARSGRFPQAVDCIPQTDTRDAERRDSRRFTVPSSLGTVIAHLVSAGA